MEGLHSQVKERCAELTVSVQPLVPSGDADFYSKHGRLHIEVENLTYPKEIPVGEHMSNRWQDPGLTCNFL